MALKPLFFGAGNGRVVPLRVVDFGVRDDGGEDFFGEMRA
jgi:hypothetical protein